MSLDGIKNIKNQTKGTVENDREQAATLPRKKLSKIKMHLAIRGVINQKFPNAIRSELKGIKIKVTKLLNVSRRTIQTIIEKMTEGKNITQPKKGGGAKPQIKPDTKKSA